MKNYGGFIPGIARQATPVPELHPDQDHWPGALYLGLIADRPMIALAESTRGSKFPLAVPRS